MESSLTGYLTSLAHSQNLLPQTFDSTEEEKKCRLSLMVSEKKVFDETSDTISPFLLPRKPLKNCMVPVSATAHSIAMSSQNFLGPVRSLRSQEDVKFDSYGIREDDLLRSHFCHSEDEEEAKHMKLSFPQNSPSRIVSSSSPLFREALQPLAANFDSEILSLSTPSRNLPPPTPRKVNPKLEGRLHHLQSPSSIRGSLSREFPVQHMSYQSYPSSSSSRDHNFLPELERAESASATPISDQDSLGTISTLSPGNKRKISFEESGGPRQLRMSPPESPRSGGLRGGLLSEFTQLSVPQPDWTSDLCLSSSSRSSSSSLSCPPTPCRVARLTPRLAGSNFFNEKHVKITKNILAGFPASISASTSEASLFSAGPAASSSFDELDSPAAISVPEVGFCNPSRERRAQLYARTPSPLDAFGTHMMKDPLDDRKVTDYFSVGANMFPYLAQTNGAAGTVRKGEYHKVYYPESGSLTLPSGRILSHNEFIVKRSYEGGNSSRRGTFMAIAQDDLVAIDYYDRIKDDLLRVGIRVAENYHLPNPSAEGGGVWIQARMPYSFNCKLWANPKLTMTDLKQMAILDESIQMHLVGLNAIKDEFTFSSNTPSSIHDDGKQRLMDCRPSNFMFDTNGQINLIDPYCEVFKGVSSFPTELGEWANGNLHVFNYLISDFPEHVKQTMMQSRNYIQLVCKNSEG